VHLEVYLGDELDDVLATAVLTRDGGGNGGTGAEEHLADLLTGITTVFIERHILPSGSVDE
jgi:hypothetical protein